jgi:integrase/recombinase XerC
MELSLFPSSEGITARQIVNVYLRYIKGRVATGDLTENVREGYERDLTSYLELMGDRLVRDLRQHDLTQWLAAHPGWKSGHTKRRAIAAVIACFRWAKDEGLTNVCYASPRCLRGIDTPSRPPMTREQFKAIMKHATRPMKFALQFLWRTGARTCEMRLLKWDDVRLEGPHPHLFILKHKTAKRTGKPRIIGLDKLAVRLLKALKRKSKSDFVFTNCDGNPWQRNAFCKQFRYIGRKIGLYAGTIRRVSAYGLRHTYACDGIEAGFTAEQMSQQLGNSPEIVMKVYAGHLAQKVTYQHGIAERIGEDRKKA